MKQKAFVNHKVNGFLLTFPNGNKLSTIFGSGAHCENCNRVERKEDGSLDFEKMYTTRYEEGSDTCEVMPTCNETVKALLDATFSDETDGSIFNYMTMDKWLKMVNILNEHS